MMNDPLDAFWQRRAEELLGASFPQDEVSGQMSSAKSAFPRRASLPIVDMQTLDERVLLQLAARAIGKALHPGYQPDRGVFPLSGGSWNPFRDSAACFELQVALRIEVRIDDESTYASLLLGDIHVISKDVPNLGDAVAAARRAIVLVAAEYAFQKYGESVLQ